MGLSQDGNTLYLVVVDGRSTQSVGMRGAELADLMNQLGAHQAFNLDGGGSSQMWVEGQGTVNNPSDGSPRSVGNHWGVSAAGSGRPAHCSIEPPCGMIPPAGGTVDEEGACFQTFGPSQYWREEDTGHGGHLFWTNAWSTDDSSNWAWWQLNFEEAGTYELEFYADSAFSVFAQTNTLVVANGEEHWLSVDQGTASGWTSLGTWDFAGGGEQFMAVYDNGDNVAADQHVVADAIRLTRLDVPTDPPDAGESPDAGEGVDAGPSLDAGQATETGDAGDGEVVEGPPDAGDDAIDNDGSGGAHSPPLEEDPIHQASGGCAQTNPAFPLHVLLGTCFLLFRRRRR
jgi:hypothetical protein